MPYLTPGVLMSVILSVLAITTLPGVMKVADLFYNVDIKFGKGYERGWTFFSWWTKTILISVDLFAVLVLTLTIKNKFNSIELWTQILILVGALFTILHVLVLLTRIVKARQRRRELIKLLNTR